MSHKTEYIWTCKIGGPAIQFQSGADAPMRQAVQAAFKHVTGNDEAFCFSGWGGELTEIERAIVENRLPSDERAAAQAAQPEAAPEGWKEVINRVRDSMEHDQPSGYPGGNSGYREYAGCILDAVCDELHALASSPTQPRPQPLTEQQVWDNDEIVPRNAEMGLPMNHLMRVVRAVEAAHGITAQEPTK